MTNRRDRRLDEALEVLAGFRGDPRDRAARAADVNLVQTETTAIQRRVRDIESSTSGLLDTLSAASLLITDRFLSTLGADHWQRISPAQGALTRTPSATYTGGQNWKFVVGSSDTDGLETSSDAAQWSGMRNPLAVYVDVEFTVSSGALTGARVDVDWINTSGTEFRSAFDISDQLSSPFYINETLAARGLLTRPAGFTGTHDKTRIRVYANNGSTAKTITFRKIGVRDATDSEIAVDDLNARTTLLESARYLPSLIQTGTFEAGEVGGWDKGADTTVVAAPTASGWGDFTQTLRWAGSGQQVMFENPLRKGNVGGSRTYRFTGIVYRETGSDHDPKFGIWVKRPDGTTSFHPQFDVTGAEAGPVAFDRLLTVIGNVAEWRPYAATNSTSTQAHAFHFANLRLVDVTELLESVPSTLAISAPAAAVKYDQGGANPDPATITFTARLFNPSANPSVEWFVNGVSQATDASAPFTFAYTPPDSVADMPQTIRAVLSDDEGSGRAEDEIAIPGVQSGKDGLDAITVTQTNPVATIPADADGNVISYSGIFTIVRVFYGAQELTVTDVFPIPTAGEWTFSGPSSVSGAPIDYSTNIGRSDNGFYIFNHANMGAADSSRIHETIRGLLPDGTFFETFVTQQIAKVKAGSDGNGMAQINVYKRSASAPFTPSGGSYDFSSGTLTPPSGWSVNPPSGTDALYISGQIITGFGSVSAGTWSTPAKIVPDAGGLDGADGASVATVLIFKRATSAPSTPTGGSYNFGTGALTEPTGWSDAVPSGTDPVYMSVARPTQTDPAGTDNSLTWSTPARIAEPGSDGADGADGAPGADGTDGVSTYRAEVYQRATSAPSAPTGGSFDFGTNSLTPPTGWSETPPGGAGDLYATNYRFQISGNTGSDTAATWAAPSILVGDGAPGQSTYQIAIYRRANSQPSTPSGGSYDFGANSLSVPAGWYDDVPTGASPVWISTGLASVLGSTATDTTISWSAPKKLAEDGAVTYRGFVYYQTLVSFQPSTPSASSYDPATQTFTGLTSGWARTQPTVDMTDLSVQEWTSEYTAKFLADGTQTLDFTVPEGRLQVASDIASDNYDGGGAPGLPGTQGWIIKRDNGFAEFGSAAIRDQIAASQLKLDNAILDTDGSGNLVVISSGITTTLLEINAASDPSQSFAAGPTTIPSGGSWVAPTSLTYERTRSDPTLFLFKFSVATPGWTGVGDQFAVEYELRFAGTRLGASETIVPTSGFHRVSVAFPFDNQTNLPVGVSGTLDVRLTRGPSNVETDQKVQNTFLYALGDKR